MTTKKKPPDEDKAQWERFTEAAREVGMDKTGEALERVFKKIVPPKRRKDAAVSRPRASRSR